MGYEFNDTEFYPCDICGEALPYEETYALEDGGIVCQVCLESLEKDCDQQCVKTQDKRHMKTQDYATSSGRR